MTLLVTYPTPPSMASLTERLAACYSGAVHDVLRSMGHENVVLPSSIKPLDPSRKLAGPAWTVSGHIDRKKTRDETLLGWCTLLSKAPSGHVVVCQPRNHEVALMGELSARTLAARGVIGYIVDGGSRDTDFVLEHGFPVFCSFLTPSDIVRRWIPDAYGAPIDIGGVTIATGDYVLGDRDGVVIVPQTIAEEVVAQTEQVVATEGEMRRALVGGMDPVEAYHKYGKF